MLALWLGAIALACAGAGGAGDDAATNNTEQGVPVAEPWRDMGLPLDAGDVIVCDAVAISVTYPEGGTPDELAARWEQSLRRLGWRRVGRDSGERRVELVFEKDGRTLKVGVLDVLGVSTVTASLDDPSHTTG